jgi:hypothetical protein
MPVRSKRTLVALVIGAALFTSGCASRTGGIRTATAIPPATRTAVGSACILPALASPPPTSAPPVLSPPRSSVISLPPTLRPSTASDNAHPSAIPPTVAPTATVGPPPATPTATRVGVPPRRQFLSTSGGEPGLGPVATPASPDQPAFSQEEVCAYARTHPPHGSKITTNAAPDYQVTAITLTTLGQFDLMFGVGAIAPADTLVYVVELAGQFTMSGGPGPGVSNSYPNYVDVFDAHSGRLLIEGGFAR